MKNMKVILAFMIVGLLTFVTNVNARELSNEEYNNLRLLFSEGRLALMTDEEVEKYLSYDFDNIITAHKYYKVTETTNGTTSSEVSAEEATANMGISTLATTHTTSYKHIRIAATNVTGNIYNITLYTEWLVTPSVKSFDVTGIRVDDATVVEGTQSGTQTYWTSSSGGYKMIDYSYNGTNIKKATNGFGISMNLLDAASYFATDITANVVATSQYATVYGTYQHAVKAVTLAQSHDYTISHNGLGGVFNFSTAVSRYYDGMAGVSIALGYTG